MKNYILFIVKLKRSFILGGGRVVGSQKIVDEIIVLLLLVDLHRELVDLEGRFILAMLLLELVILVYGLLYTINVTLSLENLLWNRCG